MHSLLKTALLLSFIFSPIVFADSGDELRKSMQVMRKSLQCIESRLPAKTCTGDNFAAFKSASQQARSALAAIQPAKGPTILALFGSLDAQMSAVETAIKTHNSTAFTESIEQVHQIMNAGHGLFNPNP